MTRDELETLLKGLEWGVNESARRLNFPRRGLQLVLQGREPVPACLALAVRYLASQPDPEAAAEADNTFFDRQNSS